LLCLFWRWGFANYFPKLASNHNPPNLSLPSSEDHRREPPVTSWEIFFFFLEVLGMKLMLVRQVCYLLSQALNPFASLCFWQGLILLIRPASALYPPVFASLVAGISSMHLVWLCGSLFFPLFFFFFLVWTQGLMLWEVVSPLEFQFLCNIIVLLISARVGSSKPHGHQSLWILNSFMYNGTEFAYNLCTPSCMLYTIPSWLLMPNPSWALWLTPVILATWEGEIRRISEVQGQSKKIVLKTPSPR
jgi:hypothetical protein